MQYLPPTINVVAYAQGENYVLLNVASAPSSETYIGKFETYLFDKTGTGAEKPKWVHYIVTAIGF